MPCIELNSMFSNWRLDQASHSFTQGEPTWSEGDVELLRLDLSDVLSGPRCLAGQGPVLHHMEFTGGGLQACGSTARSDEFSLQVAPRRASSAVPKVLVSGKNMNNGLIKLSIVTNCV